MKYANQFIQKTNNSSVRTVLSNMLPQIESQIERVVKWEEAQENARPVTEFGREIIEMTLIYDLVRSIGSYTQDSDEVVSFETGISMKGNFELVGTIKRDGQDHRFSTEVIIADGMINRAHYRYITKTTLPKVASKEAMEIKADIKVMNKRRDIQSYANIIEKQLIEAKESYATLSVMSIEDHRAEVMKNDWANNVWSDIDSETQELQYNNDETVFLTFLNKNIENAIERELREVEYLVDRVKMLTKALKKENEKLEKLA
tara:strand:- start:737 stop:1516 length:780 start_codon:yes stop_codon:yes gene_type:complete